MGNEYFTWQAALSVAGATAMVWAVNAAFQRALTNLWTDRINRIATLILAIIITEAVAISSGVNSWLVYLLQFINGCVVSLAVVPLKPESVALLKLSLRHPRLALKSARLTYTRKKKE
jgi:predicted DNA repair protein MutK